MNRKIAIAFIVIGIVITIISSVYYQEQFQSQSNWICANVDLKSVEYTAPISQGGSNPDGYQYYGTYIATIDGTEYILKSNPVSESKYINTHTTFYINPSDYTNYHEVYSSLSKFRGLGFLFISLVGVLYLVINKKEN